MKSKTFMLIIITSTIAIAFLFIHRQSLYVKYTYKKQRLEQHKSELLEKQDTLNKKLYILKNPSTVAQQARDKYALKTIDIKQIKKLVGP